jgi:glycosyltransferase involved in cell wall biosynthesis
VLVEPESYAGLVAGFADAMRRLLDSPSLAQSMGAAGRERAVRDFDWQHKVDKMIGIYRSVAKNMDLPHRLKTTSISNATASETN